MRTKEEVKQYKAEWYLKNRKRILEQRKQYREDNLDYIKEWHANYYKNSRRWERLQRLYNLTEETFFGILERQYGKCCGCLKPLLGRIDVDHNHITGQVRGLSCHECNSSLGLVKENPQTMRRLIAYLERDPNKKLVYVGGSLKNPRVPEIGNLLRKHGYDAMDEWYTPGEMADDNWQLYEKT